MTHPPENLADRPGHDVLSALLRSVRLGGERLAAHVATGSDAVGFARLGTVHFLDEGELALQLEGDPHVEVVGAGDVILLPRGDPHRISAAGSPAQPARWLCGTFTIGDPQASHLLASLPAVIILRGGGGQALEGLEVAHKMLLIEMQAPSQGSAVMVARILDLVFIQILRLWASGSDAEPNWLAGALDPQIGPALSAIHTGPHHDWTVEELARECRLSRSTFAERFTARVGTPPASYLAHVRLDAARGLLGDTSLPVTLIAKQVGYLSDAAFSRAFRSRYGTPPARWRRDLRASQAVRPLG